MVRENTKRMLVPVNSRPCGIDEATELPKYFLNRRLRTISLAAYQNIKIHPETIELLLHAEVRLMK